MTQLSIRDPAAADEPAWRQLWALYAAFYRTTLPDEVTAATWRRILDPAAPVFARLAEQDGELAGFTVSVLHEATWTLTPACYLEDFFVAENARRHGVGRKLLHDLFELARTSGWSRVYWHTEAGNAAARRLYDVFVPADDFVRYRVKLTD